MQINIQQVLFKILMNPSPKVFLFYYVITVVFSLVALVIVSNSLSVSNGGCFLYATANNSNFSQEMFKGNITICSYVLSVSIVTTLVCIVMIVSNYWLIKKEIDRTTFSTFIMLISNALISIFVLVSCILISDGIASTCKSLNIYEPSSGYYSTIYFSMKTYEVLSWICWILWSILSITFFMKVQYFHNNNDLLQSLAYEKDRLIKRRNYSVIVYEDN